MFTEYFLIARPETVISLFHVGRLPDNTPDWQAARIALYPTHEEAMQELTTQTRHAYLMGIMIPTADLSYIVEIIHHEGKAYASVLQFATQWIKRFIVAHKTAQTELNQLLNKDVRVPIEIAPQHFPSPNAKQHTEAKVYTDPVQPLSRPITVTYKQGDLLGSNLHALVNTVNCVGVMGKGIALAFKKRYGEMFKTYQAQCKSGQVKLGEPYKMNINANRVVINFPTKKHWKDNSHLEAIESGLIYLRSHIKAWGIQSLAIPPLGCGNGGLLWKDVKPLVEKYLGDLEIPIEIYVPFNTPQGLKMFDPTNLMQSDEAIPTPKTKRKLTDFFSPPSKKQVQSQSFPITQPSSPNPDMG